MRQATFRAIVLVTLACAASGCLDDFSTEPPATPGVERTLTVDERARRFRLIGAHGAAPAAGYPLLLVFHGGGGSAEEHISYTDFPGVGSNAGMIVAYMDAAEGTNGRWITHPDDLDLFDDLNYARAVIDAIDNELNVDRQRVFAAGFSRGGDFVAQVACRDPQLLRGIIAIASTTSKIIDVWCSETAQSATKPAVTIALGSQDPLMPFAESSTSRMSAPESAHYWAMRNNCELDPPLSSIPAKPGYRVERWIYTTCTIAPVQLYRIEPLGHLWPSAGFNFEQLMVQWMLRL